jgi:hypothetical protein
MKKAFGTNAATGKRRRGKQRQWRAYHSADRDFAKIMLSIILDEQARFLAKLDSRSTDLNQAEDVSPLGPSPLPDPRLPEST